MELRDTIRLRKSIRKFQAMEPDWKMLIELADLAKKGPSAGAIRGYEIFFTKEKIAPYDAPVYMVICTNPEAYAPRYGDRGRELYAVQDATIVGAYLQLLLVEKGLSSCWIGAFKEHKVKALLNTELRPVAIIAVGYAL